MLKLMKYYSLQHGVKKQSAISKQKSHGMRHSAGLEMPIHDLFHQASLTHKVGQTDPVFGVGPTPKTGSVWPTLRVKTAWWKKDDSSFVGLCTQDYKSLCVAVTIGVIVVNIETESIWSLHEVLNQLS